MKIKEFIGDRTWSYSPSNPVVGLDLGSRASKGVLLKGDEVFTALIPTGLYMQETADELLGMLLGASGISRGEVVHIVGTGYGRITLKYEDIKYQVVTEITCHAMGAHALVPGARTIVDIGGQDSKVIKVDTQSGKVLEFVMNDKCAAGTGRFLEKAAAMLGLQLNELGEVALKASAPAQVSSQCVVFAESEVISLRARGERNHDHAVRANIAAGVHNATARRIRSLLGRVGLEPELVFTGGVSSNAGMWVALEQLLGAKFTPSKFDLIFAGALGAAIHAGRFAADDAAAAARSPATPAAAPSRAAAAAPGKTSIAGLQDLVAASQRDFIGSPGGRKRVGYLYNYTPVEVFNAAGVRHINLFKAGSPEVVSRGERFTMSMYCDFTKSCLGAFATDEPIYKVLDKVYTFHTCGPIKRTAEALEQFVPTKLLNLPKLPHHDRSRDFYRDEIIDMKNDLERLTGNKVADEAVSREIVLQNQLRRYIRKFSELRKRAFPPLTGRDFLEITRAYFFVPSERLLQAYELLYRQYEEAPEASSAERPVRLMVVGSVMADGDRRLLDLLEDTLGARVVVEDHAAGLRPFYHTIAETGDPYLALAEGYLDQAPFARNKPLEEHASFSTRLAKEYDVDGIVFFHLKFCAIFGFGMKAFLDDFQNAGIPTVEISGDYSQSDQGQIVTRLEAFFEVLESRKEKAAHGQLANA
jgi:predicted CoA-substrate-specific enzyme activase